MVSLLESTADVGNYVDVMYAIQRNHKLETIALDDNANIKDAGGKAFANMLKFNTALRYGRHVTLYLSTCVPV